MTKNAQSMLGYLLHAPRGPFYSPKAARSHWRHSWKAILAFCRVAHRTVRCTTGHPLSLSGADRLPKLAQPTVEDLEPLAHRTLSSAHRTVRCPHQTVGSATRHARIARPTIGAADRWLTGQSGAPPDSPVNFSRTPPTNSRERPVDQTPAWRTGHCPVHHRTVRSTQTAQSLGCSSQVFFLLYFL
jgi:hypothetical protein